MSRYKTLIIIVLALTVLGFYKIYFINEPAASIPPSRPGNMVLSVNAILAKTGKTDNKLYISGTAFSFEEVNIMPEIAGKLVLLNIPEGKMVHKGSLLAKINDLELQAQLKKVRAEIELLKIKESRNKRLLEIQSISKEEYETSLNEYQLLQADKELLNAQILKTEIRAPISGILGFKNIGPGSYVTPQQSLTTLQQIDRIKIEFSVPEKYRSMLKPSSPIRFTLEGSKEVFEAKIDIIESKIDINTRTFKARAIYPNKQHKIYPGAFVKIDMVLKENENSIMIPSEALIPILKGYKVFICQEGKAKEIEVETGLRTESEVQITKGLQAGDTVITSGIMSLKPGSTVLITNLQGE